MGTGGGSFGQASILPGLATDVDAFAALAVAIAAVAMTNDSFSSAIVPNMGNLHRRASAFLAMGTSLPAPGSGRCDAGHTDDDRERIC
jgi:hypothetical protein